MFRGVISEHIFSRSGVDRREREYACVSLRERERDPRFFCRLLRKYRLNNAIFFSRKKANTFLFGLNQSVLVRFFLKPLPQRSAIPFDFTNSSSSTNEPNKVQNTIRGFDLSAEFHHLLVTSSRRIRQSNKILAAVLRSDERLLTGLWNGHCYQF